ncbi:hypothetical protein [Novosphingobium sp. B 225]|uniref:hypothetical protein n=1 Tax=Novosphingobium sp. B 225 TaxID=1961849 RepID=UPI000B4B110D|nr:hypothetical protein [Novosphingobium sp. B 225]
MTLALIPLLLAAAAPAPPQGGVRVVAVARAEIVAPVTNAPKAGAEAPLRLVSQTRDGRSFVEFQ